MRHYNNIDEIKQHNQEIGQHFFSKGATKFFKSRIGNKVVAGRFFITSEQFDRDHSPRLYTVRECRDGDIETIGDFQAFKSARCALAFLEYTLEKADL